MGVIPTDLCIWGPGASHVQNRLGRLTGLSFKLAGLQQLSAFYLHTIDWCLQLHSTPVEHARSRTCTPSQTWLWRPHYCIQPPPASLRIRRCQAICYFQSHVFGCIVSRNSSPSTLPELNPGWNLELISYAPPYLPASSGRASILFSWFLLHVFVWFFLKPEHTVTHKHFVCVAYASAWNQLWQIYGGKMTGPATGEQIDLESSGERGWQKMKERGWEAGGVWHDSISIRVVLDFPTFQNKDTNFSQFLSGAHGRITLFFTPLSHPYYYSLEHCGILVLKLCLFFKYQANLLQGVLFFSTAFFTCRTNYMCVVCILYVLYSVLCYSVYCCIIQTLYDNG